MPRRETRQSMPRCEVCRSSSGRARRCRFLSPRPFRVIALQHGPWYPCSYRRRVTLVRCRRQFREHRLLPRYFFSLRPLSPAVRVMFLDRSYSWTVRRHLQLRSRQASWPTVHTSRVTVKLIRSHRTSISSLLRGTPTASAMSRRSPLLCSSASCQSLRAARIVACSRSVTEIWKHRFFCFDIVVFLLQLRDLDPFCQIDSSCFVATFLGYIKDGRHRILVLLNCLCLLCRVSRGLSVDIDFPDNVIERRHFLFLFLFRHWIVPTCGIWALNLLRGGVAAARQATSRAFDSVTFARLLIRDDSLDSKGAAVAVGHNPINVIENQP